MGCVTGILRQGAWAGATELRAAQQGQLRVFQLVVEARHIEAQLAVKQIRLDAQFVGGHRFRVEGARLIRVERTRIGAARLITGRRGGIDQHFRRNAVIGAQTIVPTAPAEAGSTPGERCDDVRRPGRTKAVQRIWPAIPCAISSTDTIDEWVHRPAVKVVAEVGIVLRILRITEATREGERIGRFKDCRTKDRLGLGADRIVADELQREDRTTWRVQATNGGANETGQP